MHSSNIGDLLALAGQPAKEASGQLAAEAHIHGVYGDPLGSATLQVVNGTIENQPFSRLYGNVNLADRLITLSSLELDTAGGIVSAKGTFQHAPDNFLVGHAQAHLAVNNVQLAQVKPLQQQQPVAGLIQMTADTAADVVQQNHQSALRIANVSADVSASGLQIQHQDAGSLTASARTANGTVTYQLTSDFAGSNVHINGHTGLNPDYPTVADASIQDLSISKVLQITGETSIPASGSLSADAHMSGTLHAPDANLRLNLSHGNIYQEPINHLRGSLSYSNTVLSISALELSAPAGNISLSGTFTHPADDFKSGSLTLKVNSSPIEVSKIEHVASAEPGLKGTLQLAADASARVLQTNGSPALRFSNLNAKAAFQNVTYNATPLGGANLNAQTKGQTLTFQMDSDLAKSQIRGSGQAQLIGSYPVRASVTFANVRYSNLEPLVGAGAGLPTPADALVEGEASIDGPVLAPDNLTGRLQINRFEVMTNPQPSPTGGPPTRKVDFENKGPIILALDHSVIQVQALHITGPAANLSASGSFNLKNASSPLGLTVGASLDLAALQDVNHDFYSSGRIALNSTVHGNLSQPLANGRIELTNANINYINSPNGLSNGNGVILLNGASATIQSLTGQTGGGTVSVAGFVGSSGPSLNFNLKATAQKVRVLYSGIGVVSNANLTLLGSTRRSLLNGTVTVTRLSYTSSSDAGSLLSAASAPPATPTAPSPLLTGMHLNVHILTSPDLRVVSTYTDSLEVAANLTVRGTAESPGVLGRLTVTNGQLVFFGNTYNVQTGAINFYDPNSIDPILNISLQTVAQGVSVTIGVSGAMDDLKLTYRSDPPLTFEQIVQLLATNTTPANPVIAAQQPPAQQQSLSQMGESALLGQAVANPLASRVQRVFGLTQLKIDPSFSGTNGQPDAQISLQQKIASNITFTYITDVTQTNGQIIRVQWDLTDKLSAVGLRDYNGNVSVELFYKFTKR
ncbi:MAG: translocation/assembly module TamB domain-containing protein [Acidobacteriaceae bacterium]|nr:translocation/assembly module TamB domain-containing protein [Acidobacteriaceae bacterium]